MNTTRETGKLKFTRIAGGPKPNGPTHGAVTYEVHRDDVLLGTVERTAEASYRSDTTTSTYRYGMRGYSRSWRATVAYQHRAGFGGAHDVVGGVVESYPLDRGPRKLHLSFRGQSFRKRADAVALLEQWVDEPERRRKVTR